MSIADKFKSEWKPIVAQIHSVTSKDDMATELDKFVTVPQERRISSAENVELMQEITCGEVIQAFAELNRHKSAGPDGLNNDFYKDTQALLVPVMVVIGNEILQEGEPPPSFLEGLIIQLRTKGDSVDAMDFRPIALLQTGYKFIATVIANRAQRILGTPIGDTQQGFVKGRQMLKTVMMMLAMLATANEEPELAAGLSRLILLLDFRKAYDTVAREFLFVALLRFGLSPEFVQMIRRLHDGTTAQFLVNGELSEPLEVVSGIRQGCPLAPLLFILAAEVLALAIKQDRATTGLAVPGSAVERHKFSAFVDDSTVFLLQAQQLPRIMEIVEQFGRLSGLQVQPTKSKIIFLNTAVTMTAYMGIPVLPHGETTRYLGYAVGTGEMTNVNWAERIRKIQRRLATATQLSTSVDNRATLLNVIMLPAVLFTAAAFEMPLWADKQIRNLQKQFLWRQSTSTECSRHKLIPALLFTPQQAGGVGLASVQLACTAQRAKHTIQWLVQKKDRYYNAWREWVFRGASQPWTEGVSPRQDTRGRRRRNGHGPGDSLQDLIGPWVVPVEAIDAERTTKYTAEMENLAGEAISWTTEEEWVVELQHRRPQPLMPKTQEEQDFWPSYMWTDNPGIVDQTGSMLTAKKYDRIQPCTIAELHVQRTGVRTYTMEIPLTGARAHRQTKLRRWALAILSSAPPIEIGEELQVGTEVRMRHHPQLEADYKWAVLEPGKTIGTSVGYTGNPSVQIHLEQQPNGLHWQVQRGSVSAETMTADCRKMQQKGREGSVVFSAHPTLHSFHWDVPDTTANKHVGAAIKKQAFRRYKGQGAALGKVVKQLQAAAQESEWQAASLTQTPQQLWAHKHELTDYQVGVSYRVVVRQLNLFHEDRLLDNSCRKLKQCQGHKETLEHIFWECPCAKASWQKLITAWTGETWEGDRVHGFIGYCSSRTAPAVSPPIQAWIKKEFPDEQEECNAEWRRMWRILCSVCTTCLWIQRNRVVFHQDETNEEASQKEFWTTGIRQLKALAKRERRQPEHQINGIRLQLCINALENEPRETSPKGTNPVQPPDRKEPALLTRLRINQTSSRH